MAAGWDGEPRLGSWLVDHLNAHETDRNRDYLREAGAAWLKGVAARVLFPGCKSDNVLTPDRPARLPEVERLRRHRGLPRP
ncbi:MAG: hypothetical protein IPI57_13825 [Candidatus Competibacteraceae bacterium]|nr:hypothetical protein [Candidatus Competibacteraceae bacterium]